MAIEHVSALLGTGATAPTTSTARPAASAGFGDALSQWLGTVDTSASKANDAVHAMLDGTGDVHEAMIALQKADVALQLTVQIRNKLVQAYQDVMRMSV